MAGATSRLAALLIALGDGWQLQLNAKNLTNRTYYETDGHFGLLLPGAPVNAEVSLRFGF